MDFQVSFAYSHRHEKRQVCGAYAALGLVGRRVTSICAFAG